MKRRRRVGGLAAMMLAVGILCLALPACDGDGGDGPQRIGPLGGTIHSLDGKATLEIPAGALSREVTISLRALADSELPAAAIPGSGIAFLAEEVVLLKPARLTLRYAPGQQAATAADWLRVVEVRADGRLALTRLLAHDSAQGVMSVALTQLGGYALADLALADALVASQKRAITDVDVLFVIDNSDSMREEQQNLAQNFPRFIQQLEQADLDYRVGVISADLGAGSPVIASCAIPGGDGGQLQSSARLAGCTTPSDPWIERIDGVTNVAGDDLTGAFSCIAQLGTNGCGFEQPLEAVRLALAPELGVNPGFLRPEAALAVVLITDEDDCSAQDTVLFDPSLPSDGPLGPLTSFRCFEQGVTCAEPARDVGVHTSCAPTAGGYLYEIERYLDLFRALKPDGAVIVSAIAGATDPVEVGLKNGNPALQPSCSSQNGEAVPPVRLAALLGAMGARGKLSSICDDDFGPALADLGSLVVEQTQLSWCMPYAPLDTDAATAAIEADCEVTASLAGNLPACSGDSTLPCYSLEPSGGCADSGVLIQIRNILPANLGETVSALCLVQQP